MAYAGWPGGLFISPSMLGSRGGGAIAGAWAALCGLGEAGYLKTTTLVCACVIDSNMLQCSVLIAMCLFARSVIATPHGRWGGAVCSLL
jgi:hypothetical protein